MFLTKDVYKRMDASNAAPFYLWDQEKNQPASYLGYYGIRPEQLPEIAVPGTRAGILKKAYQQGNLTDRTAVAAGSFDHPSGARAVGVLEPGSMLLSCGTSWVGFYPVPHRDDIIKKGELCDTFLAPDGGCWGAMFSVEGIGVEIEDFILGRFGDAPDRYLAFNQEARQPDSPSRRKMREVVARFKERLDQHPPFRKVVVSGGPSEGATWPAVIEEVLRLPVELSPYRSHTGAVGAAMLAQAKSLKPKA